jgi:Dolichyl-phosphate-mannose-protein mannosyltransferase
MAIAWKARPWLFVVLVILAAGLLRWRLLDTPLERDEGEYAYSGQLMLQAIPPYLLACNMKLPGTYAAYALLMAVLGQSIAGIHLALLLVNAAAILLIYRLGLRLFGTAQAVAASAVYALLSIGSSVMGTQAHATHFVVLPALGAVLLLARPVNSWRPSTIWWAGLLFGLAFVMKQQGILFGLFGALYIAVRCRREGWGLLVKLAAFFAGAATPFALTCLLLWRAGVFPKFWFWTFIYARQYASEVSLSDGLSIFAENVWPILKQNAPIWLLAFAGLVMAWQKRKDWGAAAFATAFLLFSFLAVCPGLFFREHYFVLMLPAVALLAGASVRHRAMYWIFGGALILSMAMQTDFLFRLSPLQACRELYGRNPFPEAIPVAAYIRAHSDQDARIAVLGSEPEIYFYSHRHSATSYIYMYGLMEAQPFALTMQNDLIGEVETARPEYVVQVSGNASWLQDEQSPKRIFEWWYKYGAEHYKLVGIADIISEDRTEYRWGAAAEAYQPQSTYFLAVYRRAEPVNAALRETNRRPTGNSLQAPSSQTAGSPAPPSAVAVSPRR